MSELSQPRQALALANERRYARAALHREVLALGRIEGRERLAELLTEAPECLGSLRIAEMLTWGRMIGELQARRILKAAKTANVGDHLTVGAATERQRLALARYLRGEREGEDWFS